MPAELRDTHAASALKIVLLLAAVFLSAAAGLSVNGDDGASVQKDVEAQPQAPAVQPDRIAQLVACEPILRNYPYALNSLLEELGRKTTLKLDPQPVIISSFETPEIFRYPFIYVNYADRQDWNLSDLEKANLKAYLERGGFIFIDAGVNAEFLRKDLRFGQHHSYADWQVTPELEKAFKAVFPDKDFKPMRRTHELFKSFYSGLPDASRLPDSVRDYVVQEKWPEGTYSLLALNVKGRDALVVSPIIAMGWGKDPLGRWLTGINFRVREGGSEGLTERLRTAAYSGERFEAKREDGRKEYVYCQQEALPAWVEEPDGKWRVFRYYQSREINDFAHVFYTRLGINIFVYAFTH